MDALREEVDENRKKDEMRGKRVARKIEEVG